VNSFMEFIEKKINIDSEAVPKKGKLSQFQVHKMCQEGDPQGELKSEK
jgi:hypothetical protein